VTTAKFDSSAKAPDSDKLDGLDSSAFLPSGRVLTTGFRSIAPGNSVTLLSVNQTELIGVCATGPVAEVEVASNAGPGGYALYSGSSLTSGTFGAPCLTGALRRSPRRAPGSTGEGSPSPAFSKRA
jgi:hypothetical protein